MPNSKKANSSVVMQYSAIISCLPQ